MGPSSRGRQHDLRRRRRWPPFAVAGAAAALSRFFPASRVRRRRRRPPRAARQPARGRQPPLIYCPRPRTSPSPGRPGPADRPARLAALLAARPVRAGRAGLSQRARGFLREDLAWDGDPRPADTRRTTTGGSRRRHCRASQDCSVPILDGNGWAGRRRPTGAARHIGRSAGSAARAAGGTARAGFWRAAPAASLPPRPPLEIWNEPYLPRSAGGDPTGVTRGAAVLTGPRPRAGGQPGRRVPAPAEGHRTPDGAQYRSWIDDMYAAVPDPGTARRAYRSVPYSVDPPGRLTPSAAFRDAQDRAHPPGAGRPRRRRRATVDHWRSAGPPAAEGPSASPRPQAAYLRSVIGLARNRWSGYVRAIFVYSLADYRPRRRAPTKEGPFGPLRNEWEHQAGLARVTAGQRLNALPSR